MPGRDPRCSSPGCDGIALAKKLCQRHYKAQHTPKRTKPCLVDGCEKYSHAKGLCLNHYERWRRGAIDCVVPPKPPRAPAFNQGYHMTWVPERMSYVMTHRLLMEQVIGRRLERHETVHHKNGDRADNRLENLEVWIVQQPSGQRVEDRIADAIALLKRWKPEALADTA